MSELIFNLDRVVKSFHGRRVLDGLSWQLHAGETAVLLGPSGGGKTVFLHALLGMLPLDSGRIEAPALAGGELFAQAAVMFQEDALLDDRSVEANLAVALEERADRFGGPFGTATDAAIDQALREVRLDPGQVRRALPSALSGGMRRRVALARALVRRPLVLIADEPTTGLDPASAAAIYDLLAELIAARSMSAVIITHDPACASRLGYPVYYFSPVAGRMPRWPAPDPAAPEERHRALLLWMQEQTEAHMRRPQAPQPGPVAPPPPQPFGRLLDTLGHAGLLLGRLATPPSLSLLARNLADWGLGSLPLTALIFILLGVVMQVQAEAAVIQYGASNMLPELVALSLLRLAPILTGFLIAGRCGSAISAQTGYMQLAGQFRALRTLRIDPERSFFPPLFWSLALAAPLLTLAGIALGGLGALMVWASPLSLARLPIDFFLHDFPLHLTGGELPMVILKGMLIGAGIATIAFGAAARPKRAPTEVTAAITGSLVAAFVWITLVDTLISLLM